MEEIKLEEIFKRQNPQDGKLPQWVKEFCIEVCNKVLDLAAENAELNYGEDEGQSTSLNKNSILDIKKLIK